MPRRPRKNANTTTFPNGAAESSFQVQGISLLMTSSGSLLADLHLGYLPEPSLPPTSSSNKKGKAVEVDTNSETLASGSFVPTSTSQRPSLVSTPRRHRVLSAKAKDPNNIAAAIDVLFSPVGGRRLGLGLGNLHPQQKTPLPSARRHNPSTPDSAFPIRRVTFRMPPILDESLADTPSTPSGQPARSANRASLPRFDLENSTPPSSPMDSQSGPESEESDRDPIPTRANETTHPLRIGLGTSPSGPAGNKARFAATDVWSFFDDVGNERHFLICR
jgi:hypothetical protein